MEERTTEEIMNHFETFATLVRTMREHQKKREKSSAKLTAQDARTSEARVDAELARLFPENKEVEQPKMEL